LVDFREQGLHRGCMPGLSGADEVIKGNPQLSPDGQEGVGHLVAVPLRVEAPGLGLFLHIDAVLIVPHEEKDFVPL